MLKTTVTPFKTSRSGFTLVELLLVIVVVSIVLAVIIPRAWRARVEAKYGLVQQAATELASWGMAWAEKNIESQDENDDCTLDCYVDTLVGYTGDESNAANWTADETTPLIQKPDCRASDIEFTVADTMPPEKQLRNPFNGVSYFNPINDGTLPLQTGILYLGVALDTDNYNNYYFVYTGTDSTGVTDWHAGMGTGLSPGLSLANLRNGVFMTRLRPCPAGEV